MAGNLRPLNSVGGFSVGENPQVVVLANGDITTGNITLTGNLAANNVLTDNLRYANGVRWDFQEAAGNGNYQIQYNLNNDFGASPNFTFDPTSNLLTVVGNASIGNISVLGNVAASNFIGNFNGNFSGNFSGNIAIPGSNTYVVYNDGGVANSSAGFTFDRTTNTVNISGNIFAGNVYSNAGTIGANLLTGTLTTNAQPNVTSLGTLTGLAILPTGSIAGGNLVSANFVTGVLTTALQPNITQVGTLGNLNVQGNILAGNIDGGNLVTANYLFGNLVSSSQPIITSVGNLINLTVTGNATVEGNVNAANLGVSGNVLTSLIPSIDNTYNIGSANYRWKEVYAVNVYVGSSKITAAGNTLQVDSINVALSTSTQTLTVREDATVQGNLTVSENLTVSGNTTYINVTDLNISDPLINLGGTPDGGNATAYDGKDRGLILHNYFANNEGATNQAFVWKTGNLEFQAIGEIASITNEVITPSSFANIRAQTFIGNLSGIVTTSSQPNITSLGTLSNLVISGNLQVNTFANINSLVAGGLAFPTTDGSTGQVIATDGNGELYFTTVSTTSLANGSSNVNILQNGNINFSSAGNANVAVITGTGANVNGYLTVTGNLTTGTATVSSVIVGNTTIRAATITTASIAASQVIATYPITNIRGVIFDVKGEDISGGKYSIASVTAVHNGVDVDYSVYGTVLLGGATGSLGVILNSGNINLVVTPSSTNSTVWTTQFRTI
jgi:hypothetical protein